jgi:hypothetical protein
MEADFNQLAQHLDDYPNFAVDLAARMPYLVMRPRADMIAFIEKYQDRLLYATDNESPRMRTYRRWSGVGRIHTHSTGDFSLPATSSSTGITKFRGSIYRPPFYASFITRMRFDGFPAF